MDSEVSGTMEVAALGRPFSLGMLYDCRKDSLVPGENSHTSTTIIPSLMFLLWDGSLPQPSLWAKIRPWLSNIPCETGHHHSQSVLIGHNPTLLDFLIYGRTCLEGTIQIMSPSQSCPYAAKTWNINTKKSVTEWKGLGSVIVERT